MNKIWFPLQRAIRTAVQVIVGGAAVLATVVLVAPQIIEAVADVIPGPVIAWATAAIAALAAISAAVARVMAIPAVDEWLRKFGAGSAPTGAVAYRGPDGNATGLTRRQWRAMLDGADTGADGESRTVIQTNYFPESDPAEVSKLVDGQVRRDLR